MDGGFGVIGIGPGFALFALCTCEQCSPNLQEPFSILGVCDYVCKCACVCVFVRERNGEKDGKQIHTAHTDTHQLLHLAGFTTGPCMCLH